MAHVKSVWPDVDQELAGFRARAEKIDRRLASIEKLWNLFWVVLVLGIIYTALF